MLTKTQRIETAIETACNKNGKCASDVYINSRTKLKWECENGHEWKAVWGSVVKSGTWCPYCAGKNKYTIEDMHKIAINRNGKCLSETYNPYSKLKWQCSNGHIFYAFGIAVKNSWCPLCSGSVGERITRRYFECLFGQSFQKIRPDWLINKQGNKLELDGYCIDFKIAFEYQGSQHYRIIKPYTKNEAELNVIKERDKFKIEKCKENNIKLIIIDELFTKIKLLNFKEYIISKCKDQDIFIPYPDVDVKIDDVLSTNSLQKARDVAILKGGKCLSNVFVNSREKLEWQCEKGHRWKASYDSVSRISWCPKCGSVQRNNKKFKYNLSNCHAIAKEKNGKCLSRAYTNVSTKLKWQCSRGHEWYAPFNNIKNGHWCQKCASNNRRKVIKND